MELRRVLFEYRLPAARVIRASRAAGFRLAKTSMSLVVNGKYNAGPTLRESVRVGLAACGIPADVIALIDELQPRLDMRIAANRLAAVAGKVDG
jgi:hypothetical protein